MSEGFFKMPGNSCGCCTDCSTKPQVSHRWCIGANSSLHSHEVCQWWWWLSYFWNDGDDDWCRILSGKVGNVPCSLLCLAEGFSWRIQLSEYCITSGVGRWWSLASCFVYVYHVICECGMIMMSKQSCIRPLLYFCRQLAAFVIACK